ncbi:MAG: aspartate aminotransferase family protein [Candidatus Bathyarchaeia archaeon]
MTNDLTETKRVKFEKRYDYKQVLNDIAKHGWQYFAQMKFFVSRNPVVMQQQEGVILRDVNGKEYIDWNSGNMLAPLGYGNKHVLDAMHKQIDELQNCSIIYTHPHAVALAKKLAEILPNGCQRPYIVNAGSEATETAFKMSRQYFRNIGKGSKYMFISRYLAYHGATMGAVSATGTGAAVKFHPMVPGFLHVFPPYCYRCFYGQEYPGCDLECARAVEHTINFEGAENVAAVVGEPIIGAGGIIPPPKEYWPMVREICDKNDVLLIADEIMTGMGRTGKMFAIEHWNVKPDIMCVGKGLSAGYLPVSATCATPKITESFWADPEEHKEFIHGHSWGQSCPLSCVTVSATIDVLRKEKLADRAAEMGKYMMKRLRELEDLPIVGEVRGMGLFVAVEFVRDKKTKRTLPPEKAYGRLIEKMCWDRGLGAWCRWGFADFLACVPPLIITKEQIDKAVDIISDVLRKMSKKVVSES